MSSVLDAKLAVWKKRGKNEGMGENVKGGREKGRKLQFKQNKMPFERISGSKLFAVFERKLISKVGGGDIFGIHNMYPRAQCNGLNSSKMRFQLISYLCIYLNVLCI